MAHLKQGSHVSLMSKFSRPLLEGGLTKCSHTVSGLILLRPFMAEKLIGGTWCVEFGQEDQV